MKFYLNLFFIPRVTRPSQALSLGFYCALLLTLPACKKTSESTTNQASKGPSQQTTTNHEELRLQAEKLIKDHPNLTMTETKDGMIHFKNKYTELTLNLSFQDIVDGKYKVLAKTGSEYSKNPILHKKTPLADWGKSPKWLPRFPEATLQRGAMHSPLPDGSIWGNINILCPDTVDNVKKFYITQFSQQEMLLHTESTRNDTLILIFQGQKEEEKRQVTCTLKAIQEKTRISIQYSYGMP